MAEIAPHRPEIETSPSRAGEAAERYEALAPGIPMAIAPGIFVLRLPIPFALDHVNAYLVEDGDGWFVVDTGVNAGPCRAAWEAALAGPLAGRPVKRILVTHFHLDHIGLAGWLAERSGARVLMSERELEASQSAMSGRNDPVRKARHEHVYRRCGFSSDEVAMMMGLRDFAPFVTPLPDEIDIVAAGEALDVGGRRFEILTGGGHAPDQVMLHAPREDLFLAADQVLARISPHISVSPERIRADPLSAYLRSLGELKRRLSDTTLILPGHGVPFRGVRDRIEGLQTLHETRCRAILRDAAERPRTAREIVALLFSRAADGFGFMLALSEAIAHTNHLIVRGDLAVDESGEGPVTFVTTGQGSALLAA